MTDATYRSSHIGSEKAETYNRDFDQSFLGHFWRTVERPLLMDLFDEIYPDGLGALEHLDIACGTGRILSALSERTKSSLGVDISPDMLQFAEINAPKATVQLADVTALGRAEEFDLVTAFRFFLNAEDELRQAALRSIWEALRPGGFLVTNIHASPWSVIGLYRRMSRASGRVADNTMAHEGFAQFLRGVGLVPIAHRTYGYVPLSTKVPAGLMEPLSSADRWLSGALPEKNVTASTWLVAAQKPHPNPSTGSE